MPSHVSWREWTPDAFAAAIEQRKPVLLSLVTAWSEECAAMDRTTFADSAVIQAIESRCIPIRVDADRRPDINERYNLGGWPTTAFLTGTGDVLSGGTYVEAARLVDTLLHVANACRDRADEISARAASERVRQSRAVSSRAASSPNHHAAVERFRALMLERFDCAFAGFGGAPKMPHPHVLLLGLSLMRDADAAIGEIVEASLDKVTALWDPMTGGFSRYADAGDWTSPAPEKTLEDNALLLHVFVEAAIVLESRRWREHAAGVAQWIRDAMASRSRSGFINAIAPDRRDETTFVDRNAQAIGALIRAAALFDDVWLRDVALNALESVIVPAYKPGYGLSHVTPLDGAGEIRGLLTDQIHAASALLWAHAATGRLPYSMLAAELVQYTMRTMWDETSGSFRDRATPEDPLIPFDLNCHAACVLDRLATLTGDTAYRDRALSILAARAAESEVHDLFAAPYALAVREVVDGQLPSGLHLSRIDWGLEGQ